MRELQEETGITANQVDETQIFTEQYSFTREDKTIDKQVTYFLGNIDKNHIITIQESEIIDYKVASFSESTKILSYKTTKNVLSEAYSYLCTYHKSP